MLLYGFRALAKFITLDSNDVDRLIKSDYDLLVSLDEFNNLIESFGNSIIELKPIGRSGFYVKTTEGNYDIHITYFEGSNKYLYENKERYISKFIGLDLFGNTFNVVSLETLYEFKKSHRMIRRNFNKTMKDYYRIKSLLNKDIEESEFYKLRLKETLIRADKDARHINLNQSKDDFFNTKGVTYIYDHDSIHDSIKLTNIAMYKKILVPGEDVLCSKELWNKLTEYERFCCVLEECYTISIERFLSKGKYIENPRLAFEIALEKVCTNLCKGWFREFAYSNYQEVLNMYDSNFWNKFQNDLTNGKILPFENSKVIY